MLGVYQGYDEEEIKFVNVNIKYLFICNKCFSLKIHIFYFINLLSKDINITKRII